MPDIFSISPVAAIFFRVVVAYGLAAYVGKKIADRQDRAELFLWQYIFTFGIAAALALASQSIVLDGAFWNVVLIGLIAGGGTFFSWKAIHVSQSRNALFIFWSDLIAMSLAFFVLHEGRFITPLIGIGIALSFAAQLGFIWGRRQKESLAFYTYVAVYSVAWGLALFGQRFWSFKEMPVPTFLFGWYTGTLVVAILIFFLSIGASRTLKNLVPLLPKDIVLTFVLAALTLLSLGLASVSYRLPQTIVQPIYSVAGMILPLLIGLFIFRERRQFTFIEWLSLGLGGIGALIVSVNLIA